MDFASPPDLYVQEIDEGGTDGRQGNDAVGGSADGDRVADGGSGHACRVDCAQPDPARPRRDGRAARVDRQRVQPELRRAADHRRRAGGPLRASQALRNRPRPVRACLGGRRARAQRRGAHRRARGAGRRVCVDPAARAGAAECGLPAGEARGRDRHLQRDHRHRRRDRPASGWRCRAGNRLAVDLLDQRADRACHDPARPDQDARELRAEGRP
jgi:hypothetical protein